MIFCIGQLSGSLFYAQKNNTDNILVHADCEDCTDIEELDGEENYSSVNYCHNGSINSLSAALMCTFVNMPCGDKLPILFACSPETPPPDGLC